MRYIQLLLLSVCMVCIASCTKSNSVETTTGVEGSYTAEKFIGIGPADGSVDIIVGGGSLTMQLNSNKSYTAHTSVPGSLQCNYATGENDFSGTYTVSNDTVYFSSGRQLFNALIWDKPTNTLHAFTFMWGGQVILRRK